MKQNIQLENESLAEDSIRPDNMLAMQKSCFMNDVEWLKQRISGFTYVHCPACAQDVSSHKLTKNEMNFVACSKCGTLYMNPRPTAKIMLEFYERSENYKYWAEHIFPKTEKIRQEQIHRPRLNHLIYEFKRLNKEGGVLVEIGPGFGTFASLALSSGFFSKVIVIEPTPSLADACRNRGLSVVDSINAVREITSTVDYFVGFEVIEHLFDARAIIKDIYDVLSKKGVIAVSCPNFEGFDIATLLEKSSAIDCEHVNLFNPKSLQHLLETSGFSAVNIETPGKLDAELVRKAHLKGDINLCDQPFLKNILVDNWQAYGAQFQDFLVKNKLSSHMMAIAQK